MKKANLDSLSDKQYKKLERGIIFGAIAFVVIGVTSFVMWKKFGTPPAKLASVQQGALLLDGAKLVEGGADDKVAVVEFFDYQCPACRMLRPTFERQLKASSVQHSFYAQNLPLAQHKYARDLAVIAATLSGNEFLEFHNLAYSTPESGLPDLITGWEKKITPRDSQFVDKGLKLVEVSENTAKALSVTGTPTVFVIDKAHHKVWLCNSAATVGDTLALCQ